MTIISSHHWTLLGALILSVTTILPMMIQSALLRFWLLPSMRPHNRVFYIALTLIVVCVMVNIFTYIDIKVFDWLWDTNQNLQAEVPRQRPNVNSYMFPLLKYTFLLLVTTTVVVISFIIDEQKRQQTALHEQQMQEQLKYLRAQINPHFLFNALNCIYALTMTQDEQAPDSVLKLSEMLRYVIDDCRADKVLLTKEVKYIQNYIDFQRIRMEHTPNLTFDVQVADPQYQVPPMILQPIIENCFKHSRLVDDPQAWVHISVRQNDSGLLFICDNSKPAANAFSRQSAITGRQDEERTGIGLMNVQQRLAMLFGDKCSLKVIEDDTHYKTVLHI